MIFFFQWQSHCHIKLFLRCNLVGKIHRIASLHRSFLSEMLWLFMGRAATQLTSSPFRTSVCLTRCSLEFEHPTGFQFPLIHWVIIHTSAHTIALQNYWFVSNLWFIRGDWLTCNDRCIMNDEWRNGRRKACRMNRLTQLIVDRLKRMTKRVNQVTDFSEWQTKPVNWLI